MTAIMSNYPRYELTVSISKRESLNADPKLIVQTNTAIDERISDEEGEDFLGELQASIDRARDAARAEAGVKSVKIPDDKDYILWCPGIDDWQFAYRTDHGWVTRTRQEHWDTLISTELLEKSIPVYSKIIYLRKDES